ncbi:MAG: 50S ribosomal protein L2 [Spirochaetia bacterium]|nr:50S ribosomal protein L2 [Spirochaetia bacterium]
MGVKKFRPITPTLRWQSVLDYSQVRDEEPHKPLLEMLNYKAGRNNRGRIAMRRKGGRNKRMYRIIDFKRDKQGIPGSVASIQYDPNRTANIALIKYADGEYRYIISPDGLEKGQQVLSGSGSPVRVGNCLPLEEVPLGTNIHNIELQPGRGAQIARSAGGYATLAAKEGEYVSLKLPSGEIRKVHQKCTAVIGIVGNLDHSLVSIGKAGRARWMGRRPKVRGVAMNPIDHPLGGGEGKSSGGRHPVSPWGQPTKGYKTRKKRNKSSTFIVQRRVNKRIAT